MENYLLDHKFFISQILDNIPVAIYVKDCNNQMKYLLFNKETERITGLRREDVIGKNDLDLFGEKVWEYSREEDLKVCCGERISYQDELVDKSGAKRIVLMNKMCLKLSNEESWLIGSRIDITDLIETQKLIDASNSKLSVLIKASKSITWRFKRDTKTIIFDPDYIENNPGFAEILNSRTEFPQPEILSWLEPSYSKRLDTLIRELLGGVIDSFEEDFLLKTLHREEWFRILGIRENKDSFGKTTTLIGTATRITEKKRQEKEIEKARDKAEAANRLKSSFIANINSEINTPINSIIGFSNLLIGTEDPSTKKDYCQIIEESNRELRHLMDNIIDLSKIESGNSEFKYSVVNVNELLIEQEVFHKFNNTSEDVHIAFIGKENQCYIATDKGKIEQVLTHLIGNSMKFTKKGSILFGYKKEGDKLRFFVKDTGCGVPKEKQKMIFERFSKLDQYSTGTGIGLFLSKTIVEQLGGEVGVISDNGETGATFWFTLPYQENILK